MLYSRLLAPWLLWLVYMLTQTATAVCETSTHNSTQCLGLEESHAERICNGDMDWRWVSLAHCGRSLASSLSAPPRHLHDCVRVLRDLVRQDSEAQGWTRSFQHLLRRYDCSQPYSVNFQCHHCQEAFRSWSCSSNIHYWEGGHRIRPCRSFCHRVEQKCPFFLPLDKGPAHYAGEPTFLCLDPNIEETGEQLKKSSYGSNSCCYEECETDPGGFCLRGTCSEHRKEEEEPTSDAYSSRGSCSPTPFTFLFTLSSLLLFRTRLFI